MHLVIMVFLVRWEGAVMPFFDGLHEFTVKADDGVRFWLDDELLIDRWYFSLQDEQTASASLLGGKKYPIRLEYYDHVWLSYVQLLWDHEKLGRDFIPPSRLFPEYVKDSTLIEDLKISIQPNPVSDKITVKIESPQTDEYDISLFNTNGQMAISRKVTIMSGLSTLEMDVRQFPTGEYFLKIHSKDFSEVYKISKL